jgi:hypothetical protein
MATEYRTVYDLTPEELDELRATYYEQYEQDCVTSGEGYEAITNEMLFEYYDDVSFMRDDFFCNMTEETEA